MEDHTNDQYIACPVIHATLADLGKPRAVVKPITNPRIQGISTLRANAKDILQRYAAISDLVVFTIDVDGEDGLGGRRNRVASFIDLIKSCPRAEQAIVVAARQELEVWALWGSRSELGVPWSEVVEERDPKERFFDPLITEADLKFPGRGRERLVSLSLASGWRSLASGCPELSQLREEFMAKLNL